MIARKGWFRRRKYGGWGASPASWQGWVYSAVLLLPFAVLQIFQPSGGVQLLVCVVWGAVLVAAFADIMASIQKDERERIREAIAERNALWAVVAVLVAGVAYQIASGMITSSIETGSYGNALARLDPVLIVALMVGVLVKSASNFYLDRKE